MAPVGRQTLARVVNESNRKSELFDSHIRLYRMNLLVPDLFRSIDHSYQKSFHRNRVII